YLRQTLRQLQIDVSRIKQTLPSRTFNPITLAIRNEPSLPTEPEDPGEDNDNISIPPEQFDPDKPISPSEWLKEIKNDKGLGIRNIVTKPQKSTTITSGKPDKITKIDQIQQHVNSVLKESIYNQGTPGTGPIPDPLQAGSENEMAKNIEVDFTEATLRQYMKNQAEIMEQFKKSSVRKIFDDTGPTLDDRGKLEFDKKIENWTYQKLVKSKTISWMIDTMLEEFQKRWEILLNNRTNQLEVRWCILIDNSGSMSLHRNSIYESLVILMELLRKMEFKFAVARFGGRTNQKILKDIDKGFTDQDGQYILEAITFDEGTYPATGLQRIANKIFPKTESEPKAHQLVLMITDGLTQERDPESFSSTIGKNKINLGVMFIETIEQKSSELLLTSLSQLIKHKVLESMHLVY
ncbi:unnamed protein product, partial [Rotaria sp. Silwood1]